MRRPRVRDDLVALEGYHSAQVDVDVRLNTYLEASDVVADSPRLKISCPPPPSAVRDTAPSTPSRMSVM